MFTTGVRHALTVALAATATFALAGTGTAHADGLYYTFVAQHSGKCLDVRDGSTAHGARVHQWQCIPGLASQQWEVRPLDDGSYALINRRSGRCLDVYHASTTDATIVVQATCYFRNNQRWWITDDPANGSRPQKVVAKHSGKCLDVAWADKANGTRLVQSRCWSGANQKWQISKVS
ncbi:RICIN domain-containing protein [Nonomuraea sp. NPDC049480]|uniref:RICIN domain-containing protein n=1 Tax=Nonomuraea sp. NPDC049480 TaxID=3364353 RepID=UPI0037BC7D6B